MIYLLTGLAILLGMIIWFWKKGVLLIAEKRATKDLGRHLFPNGEEQRLSALATMEKITNNRFPEALMIDYFLKIKGLQRINMNDPVDFWTKKYLMTPTKIKLNYFEQVKFYETFLNYPEDHENMIIPSDNEQEDIPKIFNEKALNRRFA